MKASNRINNATSTGGIPTYEDPATDLARLDRFPPVLRWCYQEAATKASTRAFAAHLSWALNNGRGAMATVAKFKETERNEIAVFAGEFFAETGSKYPHTEAQASIQRYGDLGPSKHPPRRYGKPVLRPQRRRRRRWQ